MTINQGDIKFVASQVMDDVPEGGGAPTATVIADGVSNAIFADISEVARAGGEVSLRLVYLHVQTDNTDSYMQSNVIIAEPPADPNVSVTLFAGSMFGRRTEAASRIESYLYKGGLWGGMLLENHIAGMPMIQLMQRVGSELPTVGHTLALVQNEGLSTEVEQYVRATKVESVERAFYDPATDKEYQALVVTVSLSDKLRTNFTGSSASKSMVASSGAAKVRDTVVADAGTYAGVAPLVQAAGLGAFTVAASSIYTQLVPSAQTETPISDLRTNGLSSALVATGGAITQSISLAFTTSQALHLGGPVYPGSLSIVRDGVTLTDKGGLLINGGAEVGQVDYANGIGTLSSNVWGTVGGPHQVTFVPAAVPDLVSDQRAIRVTAESRSISYAFTMDDISIPGTMTISYLAQGRWYVLRDDGAGVLSGISSAYGIGTLSYTTGSVMVSLGALPDVGSSIIVQSSSKVTTVQASNTLLSNGGRLYVPINTDGLLSEEKGSKPITPGSAVVTWTDGTAKTATDSGAGTLAGDATGTIDYAAGVARISPIVLPAAGTVFSLQTNVHDAVTASGVLIAGGSLGASDITPGSVSFDLPVVFTYDKSTFPCVLQFTTRQDTLHITDDGAGNLVYSNGGQQGLCGTINYAAGTVAYVRPAIAQQDASGPSLTLLISGAWYLTKSWNQGQTGWPGLVTRTMSEAPSVNIRYSTTASAANTTAVPVTQYLVRTVMVPGYTLKGVGFALGSTRYGQLTDGTLLKDIDPTTGGGTPAGSVAGALGAVFISAWPVGASSLLADWRGLIAPPSVGVEAPFTAFSSIFRTAASPLRPGSVSVLGTMQDGTAFNVTADANGKINGTRVKGRFDYEYGLGELYFVNPNGDAALNVDLSHLQIAGLTTIPADLVMLNSIRYNAVAYSYLPMDANIIGIDPVRLPSDGRVPIFREGGYAVVGHTGEITAAVSNGQVIDCARVRLSRVSLLGYDGLVINTGYTADLEAGLVTINDTTGYSQPVTIEHRIEDMGVVRDVQISGEITFTRQLTHDFPVGSYVSTALMTGTLKARVSLLFDQVTWTGVWQDSVIGSPATGTYNDVAAPIIVTNRGTVTERWAFRFTNSTTVQVIGEHVGVLGLFSINEDCSPINPATGTPYFTIPALGWGQGWSVDNTLRKNTVGAMAPVQLVRTTQSGAATGTENSFTLLSRGDIDRP
ncbi:MAG: hypothetical protein FD135_2623 [Comamonadaceae bacterium]|nr:MAG: hypothetical protein FD135_2623 [Comamonadaceae bacterium]